MVWIIQHELSNTLKFNLNFKLENEHVGCAVKVYRWSTIFQNESIFAVQTIEGHIKVEHFVSFPMTKLLSIEW